MTRLLVGGLLLMVVAGLALGRQGVVKTRNGQTYEGDIEERADGVIVKNRGIETRVARNNIAAIDYQADVDAQLAQRLGKLDARDAVGRIALAREAFNAGRYGFARDVLEQALTIDPNNQDAAQLRNLAMAQIRMERQAKQAPATQTRAETRPASTEPAGAGEGRRTLKPNDINAIRQGELREEDRSIPVRFDRDVRKRFVQNLWKDQPERFYALDAMQQAWTILKNTNTPPEMKQDIRIMRDPPALLEYRRFVQPYVLQNCATSHCHGTSAGGEFQLLNPADTEPAAYTNFYLLQNYSKDATSATTRVFGTGKLEMIDRMQPDRSLLLQYSIPRQFADHTHPAVENYHPPLRGKDDPRYRQLSTWITSGLAPVQPSYGIEFAPLNLPARPGAATTRTGGAP